MSAGSVIPAVMEKTFMDLITGAYRRIRSWARDGSVGSCSHDEAWGCAYARAERRAGAGGELIACFAGTKTHRV